MDPFNNKRIGHGFNDYFVATSNPRYGNLRIIYTEDCSSDECQILVRLDLNSLWLFWNSISILKTK